MTTARPVSLTVLVTGSLRSKDELLNVVDAAFALQAICPQVREIRLSSTDPADVFDTSINAWLARPGLKSIRNDAPSIVVKGHRLHQVRQLEAGLAGLDDGEWVLKLRTDKLVLPLELMKSCVDRVCAAPDRFEGKFGVMEGHLFLPWYINDMAFMAQAGAIREIARFDVAADIFAPHLATEQVIWSALLGDAAAGFIKSAGPVAQAAQLHPEASGGFDFAQAFALVEPMLRPYWETLRTRFFAFRPSAFASGHVLQAGPFDIQSDVLFSRYGTWGTSFIDPRVVGELLAQVDARAATIS
jgi:hypothetical protein